MKHKRTIILLGLLILLVAGVGFAATSSSLGYSEEEMSAIRAELAKARAEIKGLKYANVAPIEQQIKQAADDWKGAYGDTKETQLYFNHKAAMVEVEACKTAIRFLVETINAITDPNDPNSLGSRVGVLEVKVADMPVFREWGESDLIFGVDCAPVYSAGNHDVIDDGKHLKFTKEPDPNEVAK